MRKYGRSVNRKVNKNYDEDPEVRRSRRISNLALERVLRSMIGGDDG